MAENERRLQATLGETGGDELRLASLDLWSIPLAVFDRSWLTRLDLSRNCLVEVPAEIASLTALTALDLSRNRLKVLPQAIGALRELRELNLMTNHLRQLETSFPTAALSTLTRLRCLDVRFNQKLTNAKLADALAALVPGDCQVLCGCPQTTPEPSTGHHHAGERDATLLRSQLEPWSTPALRRRLAVDFGTETDPNISDREEVLKLLLEGYTSRGPRAIRRIRGISLPSSSEPLLSELLALLRATVFPEGEKRERQTIQAQGYIILRRPLEVCEEEDEEEEEEEPATASSQGQRQHGLRPERPRTKVQSGKRLGWKQRTDQVKFEKHARAWALAVLIMRSVDPAYAEAFDAVAMTKNFVGSAHVDTENVAPFYGLSLGDFEGGRICVESGPFEVAEVDTRYRFGKIDGRYPHWVSPYKGERYSMIYYQTSGSVEPKTTAVFDHGHSEG